MEKMYFSKALYIKDMGQEMYEICKNWVDEIDGLEVIPGGVFGYYKGAYQISPEWVAPEHIKEVKDELKISNDGRKIELPFSLNDVAVAAGEPNVLENLHLSVSYTVNGEIRSMPLGIWCSMLKDGTLMMFDNVEEATTPQEVK